MPKNKNSIDDILRSLNKPTALDEIKETVPKPKGGIPSHGLPRWKVMPLECKIPLIPTPENISNFTRQKLGKSLFTSTGRNTFNLYDPNNNELKFPYNSLHDRNLKCYFENKNITKHMIKQGLITPNFDVKCTMKEYNMYRKYLNNIYSNDVKKELQHRAKLRDDRRVLDLAQRLANLIAERHQSSEKKIAQKAQLFQNRKEKEAEDRRRLRKKQQEEHEREMRLEMRRKKHLEEIMLRSKIHAEKVEKTKVFAESSERQRIIKLLLNWIKKDSAQKKFHLKQMHEKKNNEKNTIEERWKMRTQQQEMRIEAEKKAIEYAKKKREDFIKKYMNKVLRTRARIEKNIKKKSQLLGKSGKEKSRLHRQPNTSSKAHQKKVKKVKCLKKNVLEKAPRTPSLLAFLDNEGRPLESDHCLMTNKCKCDIGEYQFCEDVQSVDLRQ